MFHRFVNQPADIAWLEALIWPEHAHRKAWWRWRRGGGRYRGGVTDAGLYRELGEAAWAWVLGQVRHDDGPWVPEVVGDDPPQWAGDRDSLYAGIAGLAPVLAEIGRHRELSGRRDRRSRPGSSTGWRGMAAVRVEASLYDGLAGDVTALRLLAPGRERVAMRPAGRADDPGRLGHHAGRPAGARAPR